MAEDKKPSRDGSIGKSIPAKKDRAVVNDSDPIKFDSTIPVPKGRKLNESHSPDSTSNKKSK